MAISPHVDFRYNNDWEYHSLRFDFYRSAIPRCYLSITINNGESDYPFNLSKSGFRNTFLCDYERFIGLDF